MSRQAELFHPAHIAAPRARRLQGWDLPLLLAAVSLLALGLVMIASASVGLADRQVGDPTYYLVRQSLYVGLGLAAAFMAWQVPLSLWERMGLGGMAAGGDDLPVGLCILAGPLQAEAAVAAGDQDFFHGDASSFRMRRFALKFIER